MAHIVNTHEAKTHFSELIDRALAGEEIIVARAGKPMVRLVPVHANTAAPRFGTFAGRAKVHPEFFEDMTEDELADWYDPPKPVARAGASRR